MKQISIDEYVHNYYLEYKSDQLGIFFDALINVYGYSPSEAQQLFLNSKYPELIEGNDQTVILGLSGLDLYNKIQWSETGCDIDYDKYNQNRYFLKSEEYWAGWILACYQDYSQYSFQDILEKIPIKTIVDYYYPYHEADVSKSFAVFDEYFKNLNFKKKEVKVLAYD